MIFSTQTQKNDLELKFLSEKTELCEEGEPLIKAQLQSVFKQWKIQNEQVGLSLPDLTKRLIEKYGKMPPNGWTNFKLKE